MQERLNALLEQEETRQRVLDYIAEESIPYCSGVIYDPHQTQRKAFVAKLRSKYIPQEGVASVCFIPHLFGKIKELPIFVGDTFFQRGYTYDQMRHIVQKHEGTHLKQQVEGISYVDTREFLRDYTQGKIRTEVLSNILELEANLTSLAPEWLKEYRLSQEYVEEVTRRCNLSWCNLSNALLTSPTPEERDYIRTVLEKVNPKK